MLIKDIPKIMIICLVLTLFVELFIALLLKIRKKKDLINIILANVITNPIVVVLPIYFNYKYGLDVYNIILIILEFLTIVIEGIIYYKYLSYRRINPFLLSLILNILSYFVGYFFWRLV